LLLSAIDRQPQVILITSAKAAEGKSTIAENLSIALAQLDAPTLLIDCDLRRPTIRQGFALAGNSGLTSVLTARMTLEEAVQQVPDIKQLSVLSSGPLPPSPADTLASHRMADLIADAKERFTYIILDCPPALMVTDAVILSKLADAVVLVARLGQVDRFGVKRVADLFRQSKAPLVGFVLNGVTPGAMGYGDDSYLYTSYEKD
jgi:capsular exopolysaccharide synthesis family protein